MRKLVIWFALAFSGGFAVGGCVQTIHGLSSDIRSAATYVEDHTIDDK